LAGDEDGVCLLSGNCGRFAVKSACGNDEIWLWFLSPIEASSPIHEFCAIALAFEDVAAHAPRALNF
jgi:hypothetical protein